MGNAAIYKKLTDGLTEYSNQCGIKKGVLGLSGGLDSATTLKVAVDALGAENVAAIIMPETGLTKAENTAHAKGLCEFLKVEYHLLPINPFVLNYASLPWKQNEIAFINNKPRVRATALYNYANTFSALVLGTSNKSELLLGYGTKYGDLASDIMVIGDLYKSEIFELAEYLGLPQELIDKEPSAELFEGQTDEQELGGTYKDIDTILKQRDVGEETLIEKGMNPMLVRSLFQRMRANQHKLETPPIIQVT
ncbi:NAD+ synthase [Patescibacteria group bacterium]